MLTLPESQEPSPNEAREWGQQLGLGSREIEVQNPPFRASQKLRQEPGGLGQA